ncbi:MAG: D-alanyl-D-alanine carboxypeptidase [Ruminiclostridium sp.]|nr:D-alanyl-D-alanine carboxypeptidase [Ruminiclostridium sp.]
MKRFLTCIVISMILFLTVIYADDINEDAPVSSIFDDIAVEVYNDDAPDINARSAIVIDFESGRVLYEKYAYQKRPMASTTKIMTAIVALENGNLDDIVTVSKNAASIWGSTINLTVGEQLTLRELMYGLLMRSGNDAAIAIAEHIGGSVDSFLEMMNKKAKEIGAIDSNFTSPHGLDGTGHYSTAYDMAILARYALNIPILNDIVKTKTIQVGKRFMSNTNEMLTGYEGADGVKTGYTGRAGRCLVTSATRDGRRFISVALFCDSRNLRALSSKKILDYAFENYFPYNIIENGYFGEIPVYKGYEESVPIIINKSITMPLTEFESENLYTKVSLPDIITAPVERGSVLGTMSVYLNDEILCESTLIAEKTIKQKKMLEHMLDVIQVWLQLMKEPKT